MRERERCGTYKRSHPEGSAYSHGTESCANKLESAKNTSSDKKHGPLAGQHCTELSGKMAGREGRVGRGRKSVPR